jgi:hypothetical protein
VEEADGMTVPRPDKPWWLVVVPAVLLAGACSSSQPSEGAAQADPSAGQSHHDHGANAAQGHGSHRQGGHGHDSHHAAVTGDGRALSAAGHTLQDLKLSGSRLTFRVVDSSGDAQTSFHVTHTKRLHLFVFADDLTDFRHVHPKMGASGRWEIDLPDLSAGLHRVVAEFRPSGRPGSIMLGGPVRIPGERPRRPLPPPATDLQVDGFDVALRANQIAGGRTQLQVTVTDGTEPVELRPYLGSWAHAVLVHAGTFAVTHLHPLEVFDGSMSSPAALTLDVPPVEPGNYRFFVEFATADGNHQAGFTIPATR